MEHNGRLRQANEGRLMEPIGIICSIISCPASPVDGTVNPVYGHLQEQLLFTASHLQSSPFGVYWRLFFQEVWRHERVAQSPNYDQFSLCILLVVLRTLEDHIYFLSPLKNSLLFKPHFEFLERSSWKKSKKANKNHFFILLSRFVWSLVPCWVPNVTSASCIQDWGAHSTRRRAATQTGFPVLEFGLYQIALCKRQRGGDCLCQRAVEQLRSGLGGWHNWWRGEERKMETEEGGKWRRFLKNCDGFRTEICTKVQTDRRMVCIRSIWHQNICTNIFLREK